MYALTIQKCRGGSLNPLLHLQGMLSIPKNGTLTQTLDTGCPSDKRGRLGFWSIII
jgi:hypothetical protein